MIFLVIWFLLGILGYNLGEAYNLHNGRKAEPAMVWFSILGPVLLLIVILVIIND